MVVFPGTRDLACLVEIYQDSSRSDCYFCRMEVGELNMYNHNEFKPNGNKYEVPLNGPGKSKAKKKIKKHLFAMGHNLRDIIVFDNHTLRKEGDKYYITEKR